MTPLGVALAAPAAGVAPITKIEVFDAPYRVTSYFRFLPKPERPSLFVKVTTEDNSTGWGQSVPLPTWSYETEESVTTAIQNYLAPALIGKNPFDLPAIHEAMRKAIGSSFSTGMPIAKAGIDLAPHVLAGRVLKRSVPEMWDRPAAKKIDISWTVNVRDMAEAERVVQDGVDKGYKHFNLKVAPDVKFDLELCKYVRSAIKHDFFFWIDANGVYDLATAIKVAPKFADLGVNAFEQPIAPNRLTGLRELKQHPGVVLTDPNVSLAASLQLFGAYQLKYPAALNGLQFLASSYLKTPFGLNHGALEVPTGVGLGVVVDEEKLRT